MTAEDFITSVLFKGKRVMEESGKNLKSRDPRRRRQIFAAIAQNCPLMYAIDTKMVNFPRTVPSVNHFQFLCFAS
jgi:hypothetical protein